MGRPTKPLPESVVQSGGISANILSGHYNYNLFNSDNYNDIIIRTDYEGENYFNQINKYVELLGNFMKYDSGVINFDFINNFYRYIFHAKTGLTPDKFQN
jgi:hypothetical protein